jgi:hypothetical protein
LNCNAAPEGAAMPKPRTSQLRGFFCGQRQEMLERAELMQAESASASASPLITSSAVTSSVQRSFV